MALLIDSLLCNLHIDRYCFFWLWKRIKLTTTHKANAKNFRVWQVRFLLKNVCGEAKPGRLLALMGPSGSGKTTLLNVLAGQTVSSPRLHLSGLLEVNGQPMLNKPFKFAYVRQEDLFFSQLTVRETLSLAAELQLKDISSKEDGDECINNLLFKLGLVSCADTWVGMQKYVG